MKKIDYVKLITHEQIDIVTSSLALDLYSYIIHQQHHDTRYLFVNVLDGATKLYNVLYDKLLIIDPNVSNKLILDTIKVCSYNGLQNIGFNLEKDCQLSYTAGTDKVIIVDDIRDSGNTLFNIVELLKSRGFTEFMCVTLLRRETNLSKLHPDAIYKSKIELDTEWVCGFGMDSLDGTYRDKEDIYQIIQQKYD